MQDADKPCSRWRNCNSINHKHCVKSWRNLVRLWRAKKLCDVVVNVKGQQFHCHSVVPASASSFFRKAFLKKQNMSVSNARLCEKEIVIDFMNEDVFAQVLHFMYTAELKVSSQTIRPLILAAGALEMQTMINCILNQLLERELDALNERKTNPGKLNAYEQNKFKKKPAPLKKNHAFHQGVRDDQNKKTEKNSKCPEENCCGYLSDDGYGGSYVPGETFERKIPLEDNLTVAGLMDEIRIQGDMLTLAYARNFAVRHFSEISECDSFLAASVHTVACMIEDDRLNVDEFHVFRALCRWLEAEHAHMVHAPYLLSKVRLQLLTPRQLAEHVETKGYLMKKKKCRVNILEAFRFHCLKSQTGVPPDTSNVLEAIHDQKPRKGTSKDYDSNEELWSLDEEGGLVKKDKNSPFCPVKPCACCPEYIIASGGIDTRQRMASDAVYKYAESDNRWLRFARMQQTRNHHASVYCKGSLYIIGGSDPSLTGPGAEVCPVATCHRLGLGSLKWCRIESMSTPRMSLQAVYVNNYIYAIGGQDHKQRILRDLERYSLEHGTWEYAGTLLSSRAGVSACNYNGRLWVIGGYSHKSGTVLDKVEMYNEGSGNWDPQPPLRFPRCFASTAVCKRRLYVFGGAWLDAEMDCSNFSSVYDVDIFNGDSKAWEGITALKVGRHDAGMAVVGPRMYIVGGKHCDEGTIKNLDTIECYDAEKQDWIDGITPLPLPLLGASVVHTF